MGKNPKKLIYHCPAKKEKGPVSKNECPAVKNVREIRKKLNTQQRTGKANEEELSKLRECLRKAKTDEMRNRFCEHCYHRKKTE